MKNNINEAIRLTKEALDGIEEPYRSLSFPVVLGLFLQEESAGKMIKIVSDPTSAGQDLPKKEDEFKGLTGGLRFLVKEGFFKEGRTQSETLIELKRLGYHYQRTALPGAFQPLSGLKGPLTRFEGEDGKWRYVVRK
ncbi:MAG: hypothetical protein AAB389_02875 [Patescibacteria group bacterium]